MWRRRADVVLTLALLMSAPAVSARVVERIDLALASGREIRIEIRRPMHPDGPLPAVMLFGGLRGAATVLDAVPQDLPIAAASFDYPFDPPRDFEFPGTLRHIPAMARGIDETFEGIRHLSAHLRARADIDGARITIVGASLGAPFATISAVELDLPGLVIVHGFGEIRRVIGHQLARAAGRAGHAWMRWPAQGFANLLTWGLRLPAPERYAPRLGAHQRALMIVAGDDELIPAHATETLWSALQASDARVERIDEPGGHLQGTSDPRIGELVAVAMDWMQRNDLR
ncbi:alpha/beta hydrolase family protein [Sinimarinibacterium thermocellulolyticum]|uniref:Peptidase S9 prolyl oligopeptidase catalytic domain-containing protein n=1 Tax=Sinimarinibacterium thermocellulolyticum TaxID=3170016 RepID=A0ABV2ACK1_9GAMM